MIYNRWLPIAGQKHFPIPSMKPLLFPVIAYQLILLFQPLHLLYGFFSVFDIHWKLTKQPFTPPVLAVLCQLPFLSFNHLNDILFLSILSSMLKSFWLDELSEAFLFPLMFMLSYICFQAILLIPIFIPTHCKCFLYLHAFHPILMRHFISFPWYFFNVITCKYIPKLLVHLFLFNISIMFSENCIQFKYLPPCQFISQKILSRPSVNSLGEIVFPCLTDHELLKYGYHAYSQ